MAEKFTLDVVMAVQVVRDRKRQKGTHAQASRPTVSADLGNGVLPLALLTGKLLANGAKKRRTDTE